MDNPDGASLFRRGRTHRRHRAAEALGLTAAAASDDDILDAMVEHPILVEHAIVATPTARREKQTGNIGLRIAGPRETKIDLDAAKPPGTDVTC